MLELGLSKKNRYSDLYDEVQVKDEIPLSSMSAVTMPLQKMTRPLLPENFAIYIVLKQIEQVKELLIKYNYDVPMYDINTFTPLEDEQSVKTLVRTYYKK